MATPTSSQRQTQTGTSEVLPLPPVPYAPFGLAAPMLTPEEGQATLLSQILPQYLGREGGWYALQQAIQSMANASPIRIGQMTAPHIAQLGETLQQALAGLSRRVGPMGGGQVSQGIQDIISKISGDATQMLIEPVTGAQKQLQGLSLGTNINFSPARRQESTSTGSGTGEQFRPFDWNQIGPAALGMMYLGRGIQSAWPWGGGGNPATTGGMAPQPPGPYYGGGAGVDMF